MMKDGVRPVKTTLFIVIRYGVIYRLQRPEQAAG